MTIPANHQKVSVGVIGGSGLYHLDELELEGEYDIMTPWVSNFHQLFIHINFRANLLIKFAFVLTPRMVLELRFFLGMVEVML
jgi:purine nucleoside phosphorylase